MVTFFEGLNFENPLEKEIERLTQYNLQHYGFPVLHSALGGRWVDDLYPEVKKLLEYAQYVPMEIIIKPEDDEAHHWSLEFYVLTHQDNKLVRAIDYERNKIRGLEHGK